MHRERDLKLGYVILYVPDVAKAVAFYEKAFQIKTRFIHESGKYAELETGETALAFAEEEFVSLTCHQFRHNRLEEAPSGSEIAFVVDDVKTAFDKAVQNGATVFVEPLTKPWGQTVSYVRDLNGYLVELCSPVT